MPGARHVADNPSKHHCAENVVPCEAGWPEQMLLERVIGGHGKQRFHHGLGTWSPPACASLSSRWSRRSPVLGFLCRWTMAGRNRRGTIAHPPTPPPAARVAHGPQPRLRSTRSRLWSDRALIEAHGCTATAQALQAAGSAAAVLPLRPSLHPDGRARVWQRCRRGQDTQGARSQGKRAPFLPFFSGERAARPLSGTKPRRADLEGRGAAHGPAWLSLAGEQLGAGLARWILPDPSIGTGSLLKLKRPLWWLDWGSRASCFVSLGASGSFGVQQQSTTETRRPLASGEPPAGKEKYASTLSRLQGLPHR